MSFPVILASNSSTFLLWHWTLLIRFGWTAELPMRKSWRLVWYWPASVMMSQFLIYLTRGTKTSNECPPFYSALFDSCLWGHTFHHLNTIYFSVANGTAVCWGTKYDKAFKSHNSYCSKDAVEVYWSSFAVHRDSPLKVNLGCEVKYIFYFMNWCFFHFISGPLWKYHFEA